MHAYNLQWSKSCLGLIGICNWIDWRLELNWLRIGFKECSQIAINRGWIIIVYLATVEASASLLLYIVVILEFGGCRTIQLKIFKNFASPEVYWTKKKKEKN